MEIIVISVNKYKEKDAIINAICDGKTISFLAKGILCPNNKNSFLNCILCKADISLIEGKIKHPILEKASLIYSPLSKVSKLDDLNTVLMMDEAMLHLFDEEERFLAYNIIDKSLLALKKGASPFVVALYFLLRILPFLGFELEVKKCVNCGSTKSINDFSFLDGGFLCKECSDLNQRRYSNDQLLLIRNSLLVDEIDIKNKTNKEEIKPILFDANEFITDGVGYHLKYLDTLLK